MRRSVAKRLTDAIQLHRHTNPTTSPSTSYEAASDVVSSVAERILQSRGASTSGRSSFITANFIYRHHSTTVGSVARNTSQRRHFLSITTKNTNKRWSLPSPSQIRKQIADHMYNTGIKPSYDYILGTGYNARIAVINALYTMQPSTNWARMIPLLMAEAVTRGDPTAWCYRTPITQQELLHLEIAEAAEIEAALKSQKNALMRFLSNAWRLFFLTMLFIPVVLWAPFAFSSYNLGRKQWMTLLRLTLETAGPAFIKWGQWAATRHDLFPPDFCSELERLHTSAPAHGELFTRQAVECAFGFTVEDLFHSFDAVPVASGSIGQIHRGTLSATAARLTGMEEGTVVAIKVRHPGVSEAIERDFALMLAAAQFTNYIPALAPLRLEESLSQFAAPLREQVDLGREAYHLHAFNYNFRTTKGITFPIPLYPLAAPSVLVETFEGGDHIGQYVARGPGAAYNSELARLGAYAMLRMMIVDNLIHADLHPGNILVRLEPQLGPYFGPKLLSFLRTVTDTISTHTNWDVTLPEDFLMRPKMILLDAGMATHLNAQDQVNMAGLFEAFSRTDGRLLAEWVLRFSGEEQSCPDPEGFRTAVEAKFDTLKQADAFRKGDTSNGAEALADVLEDVRQYRVDIPGHIVATVVTTLVLEGWSFNLDPEHSTLQQVKRIIKTKRGETRFKRVAAWVASAADREILEHVPKFEPAPLNESPLWASLKESIANMTGTVVGSGTSSIGSTGGKVVAVQ